MPHVVEFACDSDKHAKMFLDHNFRVNALFDDCSAKSFLEDVPSCDILSAGPPCQSFSTQGLNLGLNDNRGLVMFDVIRYLKKFQPRPRCHRIARDLDYSADSGGQSARHILATITSACFRAGRTLHSNVEASCLAIVGLCFGTGRYSTSPLNIQLARPLHT